MSGSARDRANEAAGWLRSMVSTSSRDWGQASGDALIYGVLVGWDCPPGVCDEAIENAEHWCERATADLAARHGWTVATVEKMRERNAALRALAGEAGADVPAADDVRPDDPDHCQHCGLLICTWSPCCEAWEKEQTERAATAPAVWWSPTERKVLGLIPMRMEEVYTRELPSDAVRLVPAAGRDREPAPVYPQEWCDDMAGPNGAGGPCVLGPGHHHRDGIGGEWAWGASVVPAAAPEPDEGGPVSYEPATPEAEQLAELIAPVMGAWTLGSPLHDRAPRQVAEAVIRAGWSVPAAAPTPADARLLDMDRDAAIEAGADALAEMSDPDDGGGEFAHTAVIAALDYLSSQPYPVTLGPARRTEEGETNGR